MMVRIRPPFLRLVGDDDDDVVVVVVVVAPPSHPLPSPPPPPPPGRFRPRRGNPSEQCDEFIVLLPT